LCNNYVESDVRHVHLNYINNSIFLTRNEDIFTRWIDYDFSYTRKKILCCTSINIRFRNKKRTRYVDGYNAQKSTDTLFTKLRFLVYVIDKSIEKIYSIFSSYTAILYNYHNFTGPRLNFGKLKLFVFWPSYHTTLIKRVEYNTL